MAGEGRVLATACGSRSSGTVTAGGLPPGSLRECIPDYLLKCQANAKPGAQIPLVQQEGLDVGPGGCSLGGGGV